MTHFAGRLSTLIKRSLLLQGLRRVEIAGGLVIEAEKLLKELKSSDKITIWYKFDWTTWLFIITNSVNPLGLIEVYWSKLQGTLRVLEGSSNCFKRTIREEEEENFNLQNACRYDEKVYSPLEKTETVKILGLYQLRYQQKSQNVKNTCIDIILHMETICSHSLVPFFDPQQDVHKEVKDLLLQIHRKANNDKSLKLLTAKLFTDFTGDDGRDHFGSEYIYRPSQSTTFAQVNQLLVEFESEKAAWWKLSIN